VGVGERVRAAADAADKTNNTCWNSMAAQQQQQQGGGAGGKYLSVAKDVIAGTAGE
jgi:hypothetical protein